MSDSTQTIPHSNQKASKYFLKFALLVPFFLSAALHITAVFKLFAALPMYYAFIRHGRFWGIVSAVTNISIVWILLGRVEAAWFFVFSITIALTFSECVKLKLKVEWITLITMAMMLFTSSMLLISYSRKIHRSPIETVRMYLNGQVDEFLKNAEKYKDSANLSAQDIDKMLVDPEVTKKNILQSLPSVGLIFLLIVVAANLLIALRLNIQNTQKLLGLNKDFFKNWKSPPHMVWPTLVCGFLIILEVPGGVAETSQGLFRMFMVIYGIHGLAIMSAFFDSWKVKSAFRPLAYVLAITFLLPLVISMGFFDLWFSFRERFHLV